MNNINRLAGNVTVMTLCHQDLSIIQARRLVVIFLRHVGNFYLAHPSLYRRTRYADHRKRDEQQTIKFSDCK